MRTRGCARGYACGRKSLERSERDISPIGCENIFLTHTYAHAQVHAGTRTHASAHRYAHLYGRKTPSLRIIEQESPCFRRFLGAFSAPTIQTADTQPANNRAKAHPYLHGFAHTPALDYWVPAKAYPAQVPTGALVSVRKQSIFSMFLLFSITNFPCRICPVTAE